MNKNEYISPAHNLSVEHMDELIPLISELLEAGHCVRFSPSGISMLPMIRQGRDSVVLSPVPPVLRKYDIPLYKRDDGKYILHRIVDVKDTYTCIGDNQFRYEHGVRHGQILAVVTAFTRDGKLYKVSDTQYRIYCVFWHYSRGARLLWRRLKNRCKHLKSKIKSKQNSIRRSQGVNASYGKERKK